MSAVYHYGLVAGVHLACLGAIWTGVEWQHLLLCALLYVVRMFGVTAGYHRYFAHRSFKTSRPMQLALAVLAMTSGQKGVLWWAWHHRHHHRHSDTPQDFHSPRQQGFWHSHLGWWLNGEHAEADHKQVRDLVKFPELLFLERNFAAPALALSLLCLALGGWGAFVVGFCWSTVLVWHGTFTINSLSHVWGTRDHDTTDDSRNNAVLAIITMGEGWHNNHHRYPSSARQGMTPSQIDLTWWGLLALERLGLVWDLRVHPASAMQKLAARQAAADGRAA